MNGKAATYMLPSTASLYNMTQCVAMFALSMSITLLVFIGRGLEDDCLSPAACFASRQTSTFSVMVRQPGAVLRMEKVTMQPFYLVNRL